MFAYIATPTWIPYLSGMFPEIPIIFTFPAYPAHAALPGDHPSSPAEILFLVWNVVMVMALIAQNRFKYYFAVNAALLMGYLAARDAPCTKHR